MPLVIIRVSIGYLVGSEINGIKPRVFTQQKYTDTVWQAGSKVPGSFQPSGLHAYLIPARGADEPGAAIVDLNNAITQWSIDVDCAIRGQFLCYWCFTGSLYL